MIRSDNGVVELRGNAFDVLVDFSIVAHSLKNSLIHIGLSDESAKERIMNAVETGLLSQEEIDRKNEETAKEIDAIFRRMSGI